MPEREEAGSPNVIGVVALYAAVEKLSQLGMANVARHEEALTGYALERLAAVPGLRVLGPHRPRPSAWGRSASSCRVSRTRWWPAVLSYEWGIGVRAGCFCAHPAMAHLLERVGRGHGDARRADPAAREVRRPGRDARQPGALQLAADVDTLVEALGRSSPASSSIPAYTLDRATNEYAPQLAARFRRRFLHLKD